MLEILETRGLVSGRHFGNILIVTAAEGGVFSDEIQDYKNHKGRFTRIKGLCWNFFPTGNLPHPLHRLEIADHGYHGKSQKWFWDTIWGIWGEIWGIWDELWEKSRNCRSFHSLCWFLHCGFPQNISLQFLADHSARASQWNLVFSFTTAFSIPL